MPNIIILYIKISCEKDIFDKKIVADEKCPLTSRRQEGRRVSESEEYQEEENLKEI